MVCEVMTFFKHISAIFFFLLLLYARKVCDTPWCPSVCLSVRPSAR
jgi:hypothetical protein